MLSGDSGMNLAVFSALSACLGVSGSTANEVIQKAYAEPENPIRAPRNRRVVYYYLETGEASRDTVQTHQPSVSYKNRNAASVPSASAERTVSIHSFLGYRLHVICYGDSCEYDAHRIRSMLYLDGAGKPRAILRAAGIFPVPGPAEPVLLREEENSLWRKRADLTISFRVTDEISASQPAVTVKPNIMIHSQ